jgi:L-ascorbate metabolism protein UlaG (beta-lactamase superfamily)
VSYRFSNEVGSVTDTPPGLGFTWWGHATVTVELGGVRVATDPLLADRLFHLRRYARSPVGRAYDADVILLSHLHHDHCHVPSLRGFPPDVPIVVPRGGERYLRGLGSRPLVPAAPGDDLAMAGLRIAVLPATHDGRRNSWSRISPPALGFRVIGGGRSFWFPGDSELRDDMNTIDPVDLALVPIGGWGPTLADGHMHPEAGALAVARVGANWAVPIHWGTFWPRGLRRMARANHRRLFTTPGERFVKAMARDGSGVKAWLAEQGERVVLVP